MAFYARGHLSFGKASELAGVSRFAFSALVAQRDIPAIYGQEELNEDAAHAGVSNTSPIFSMPASIDWSFCGLQFGRYGYRQQSRLSSWTFQPPLSAIRLPRRAKRAG